MSNQPTTTTTINPDIISNAKKDACKRSYEDFAIDKLDANNQCLCMVDNKEQLCNSINTTTLTQTLCSNDPEVEGKTRSVTKETCICPAGQTDEKNANGKYECIRNDYGNLGIECSPEQMRNGTCSRNINKTLGIRQSDTTSNPTLFVQDIVLAATSFIGTLMVIALVVMGFRYVQGGMDESSTGNLKGNIKKLLIGLGLVIGSYTIIRLIQYIARGY